MENTPLPERSIQDDKFLNALAEAFRLQEAILNSTQHGIISTNQDGIITSINRAAEHLFGYIADEVSNAANILVLFDLDEVAAATEAICTEMGITTEPVFDVLARKVSSGKGPYSGEWSMQRKDNSKFPAIVTLSPLRDEDASVIGYVAIVEDVSEKKKALEKIEAAERKFRLLAENIPGVIYLLNNDQASSVLYINDRIKDISGYEPSEFTQGKVSLLTLCHPDDQQMVRGKIDDAVAKKKSFQIRYRIRHCSGEWRWVDEVGIGVYEGEHLLMLEGFISDITEQKKAEEKLESVAQENLRVFNNPVNLNAIAGFDGFFKRLSPSWTKILGWTTEELQAKPFIEFVHPDDVEATKRAAQFISQGNNLYTFENRYRCKDGSYRWLLWGSASDVEHQMMYASAIDITERKKSEEELIKSKKNLEAIAGRLQEQNRQLDEFAHIISHNLRSPIGNIQALINLLDANSGIADYRLIFEKLRNVAKNLGETMNDLMDTLKVRTNTNIERSDIRFKEILDKVVQTLEGELIMAEASVTFDFNEASNIVYPRTYLESIFQNLLSNAIKYRSLERKPLIHFETAIAGTRVQLRVSDNGLGIDMEKFGDKLFGLHKTFHLHDEARGVGLFLIKTQVESMGGSIAAESAVDKGTTFIITF